ncbi:hypothetical protein RMSM_00790 [Rhodopirellula maiorica SM1]|uniref:Uncharacterized protein n=1 Tax=Rhodopirellula maiorica SM1 TaxID=1265738 RepID=M5S7X0_9BACT|nr:hypothetical protein [Rhodopirellula maiorica]EMI22264.1 hypothetical protein RMSM_00790 [Rhodopirellula maiorica SM1]
MSTMLEDPVTQNQPSHGTRLQAETTAARLHIRWPGTRKSLSRDQKLQAAGAFDADSRTLSAAKRLFDTSHPSFRAVSAIKTKASALWKGMTLPYIEPGVRLLRRGDVSEFDDRMIVIQVELSEAVDELDISFAELVDQARNQLGHLFDPTDYPDSVSDLFGITWDFPSVTPPAYLRTVNPELYEQECQRVKAKFAEAVELAEQTFAEELSQLVGHLAERLSGSVDGKPKVFRDSAIANLSEFFGRFQHLNIGSNDDLNQLVENARQVITGVDPQDLRNRSSLRERVARSLTEVEASLDELMTDRPRRNIIRGPR